jgi:hypothetical protein
VQRQVVDGIAQNRLETGKEWEGRRRGRRRRRVSTREILYGFDASAWSLLATRLF